MSAVHGTKMIAIEDIELNYRNPRQDFSKESLKELADSLKMHGQLQPIVVRRKGDKYELVIGEDELEPLCTLTFPSSEQRLLTSQMPKLTLED